MTMIYFTLLCDNLFKVWALHLFSRSSTSDLELVTKLLHSERVIYSDFKARMLSEVTAQSFSLIADLYFCTEFIWNLWRLANVNFFF